MGDEERTAIAETIVDIDRMLAHQSLAEQERLMRRRLALVKVLRIEGRESGGRYALMD